MTRDADTLATIPALPLRRCGPWLHLRAVLCAVLLVLGSFPDVLFSNATLVNAAGFFGDLYGVPTTSLYPERSGRSYHHGLNDSGGAVWQSDPMRLYMAHALQGRESLWWNTYSAAGSLGPETLVDQKFSPLTLAAAAFGGGEAAADAVLLGAYALSLYALYLVVAGALGLSEGAAVLAGVIFLLNGFNVANLGSNVTHAYVLFPLLLYALTAFARHRSGGRFVWVVLANTLILATTFMPVSVVTLLGVYTLAAAYTVAISELTGRTAVRAFASSMLLAGASLVAALLLLAPLYAAIVEGLSLLPTVEAYAARVFFPVGYRNLIGVLSPKHFWESYTAIDAQLLGLGPDGAIQLGNGAFHLGIAAVTIAALGLTRRFGRRSWVHLTALLLCLLALGRIYAVPPIGPLLESVYGLRSIGCQYWWALVGVTFPILAAFGFQALRTPGRKLPVLILVSALVLTALGLAWEVLGWVRARWLLQFGYLCVVLAVLAGTVWLVRLADRHARRRWLGALWRGALVLLVFTELTFDMNHLRPTRDDAALAAPGLLAFFKGEGGDGRLANFGFAGIPPEYGSALRVPEVGSMNINILPWYKALFEQAFMLPPQRPWAILASLHYPRDPPDLDDRLIDLMAVRYLFIPVWWTGYHDLLLDRCYPKVYADRRGTLYENRNACPRVYAVRRLIPAPGLPSRMQEPPCEVVFSADPALIEAARALGLVEADGAGPDRPRETVNATACPGCLGETAGAAAARPQIDITVLRGARVRLRVTLAGPAVLVVADAWHPNWRTWVDGREVHTGRVNGAFRGIALPAGEHRVEMRYRPRSLTAALGVSAATLALLVLLLVLDRRRRRRARVSAPRAPGQVREGLVVE